MPSVGIGKRFINLAKSELNELLDKAASSNAHDGDSDGNEDLYRRYSLDQLTDEELEAELDRRHLPTSKPKAAPQGAGARSTPGARHTTRADPVAQAYAALEVGPGSDFATVRTAYRQLMRKYHPDRHTQSADKQKTANELAQRLTFAYELLEKRLRKP